MRHALAARASVEENRGTRNERTANRWRLAVGTTHGDHAAVSLLAELAQAWGWDAPAADLWWQLAQLPGGARLPLQHLWSLTLKAKDTPALLGLARRIADLEPAHPAAINNLAWLLLLRGEELPRAHRLAGENFARHPESPTIRGTAAYSLHLQGKHAEAAALLLAESTAGPPTDPALAACRGFVLAAAGRDGEAKPLLARARQAVTDLLPEERRLVEPTLVP